MRGTRNEHLLGLLVDNEALRKRGFSLSCTANGQIVIDRSGHVHGIWDFDGRDYAWISPGCSEPAFRTDSANSAVVYTLVALSQG